LGGTISHVLIRELTEQVFHASLFIDVNDDVHEIDCRPSDAIAVAVRAKVPIFANEEVLEEAGVEPEPDLVEETEQEESEADVGNLDAFSDFLDTLDFDDFEGDK
jgi:hypothetical protein